MQLNYLLPYEWVDTPEGRQTCQNDQRWLNGITSNAARFSDWWTKARVIQLAYVPIHGADPSIYRGLKNPAEIVSRLFQELWEYCETCNPGQVSDVQACEAMYPGFARWVTEDFVVKTLNAWKGKQFTQAIGRNFEVYRYIEQRDSQQSDRVNQNTYLVVSTASVSLAIPRVLPNPQVFRPLFNVDELALIIHNRDAQAATLRTHGYANPAKDFFKFLANEANALFATKPIQKTLTDPKQAEVDESYDVLAHNHFYIGYHWPSEFPLFNRGLFRDSISNVEILLKFLVSLLLLSFLPSAVLLIGLKLLRVAIAPTTSIAIIAGVYILWLSLFSLLRGVVYQRDRYRAIHYGAPDLAEFFWRLDQRLTKLTIGNIVTNPREMDDQKAEMLERKRLQVNLIGHSMGGLVLVNVLRVLSDRFGKDDLTGTEDGQFGNCLNLGKIILVSPDIPLELIREGRNNYVRSAMRRCEQIYLMSSDRDIVLRYLSTLGNWFTEPSIEMSGLRLGNLFLPSARSQRAIGRNKKRAKLKTLLVRGAVLSRSAVRPTSAYDLFENINYLDCSKMIGVNGVGLDLNVYTAILIDLGNAILYLAGRIDAHGGYFFTYTPTFKLMPFLMQAPAPTEDAINQQLERWDPNHKMIRFMYRMTPTQSGEELEQNPENSGDNKREVESTPS